MHEWLNDIHQGDAAETLAQMPENSVHCVMTSPPYFGLRDYGSEGQIGLEDSLDEYIQNLVEVGDEMRRVLRDDGSWWLNLGDSFAGSGGSGGQWTDQSFGSVRYAGDAGDSYNGPLNESRFKRKSKMLVPHRVAIALQDQGWIVRNDVTWVKPNPMPESVKDRLTTTTEQIFHLTVNSDYWYDLDAIREPYSEYSREMSHRQESEVQRGDHTPHTGIGNSDNTREDMMHPAGKNPGDVFEVTVKPFPDAHFAVYPPELCRKPIKATCPPEVCAECGTPYDRDSEVVERELGGGVSPVPEEERGYADRQGQSQNDREGLTQPTKRKIGEWEQHCECETTETDPGIVLDPFAGAGTTCLVAKDLRRRFIGVDLNPDYVALAQRRVGIDVDEPELLRNPDDPQQKLPSVADGEEGYQ